MKEEARQVALFYLDEGERKILRENEDLKRTKAKMKQYEEAAQRQKDMVKKATSDDVSKYLFETIKQYKESQMDDHESIRDIIDSFEKLSVKEKNSLVVGVNAFLDDKGKNSTQMVALLNQFVKEGKMDMLQFKEFCQNAQTWPKLIKIQPFTS